ncbi:hypothetical protein CH256_26215 [Rhodococcus sp. 05-2254-6]|uniref:hypothetical protein n=1 Tax=Rhodococcus sp. 05-2254-6 TaxID=2022489 RepID=UPI000B9A920A|nr:hypothetical protein [Rhodococcus sp. 05-2254-6]OZE18823.1 hypothetical protein CH256_26215 [Rhodococcus sp. 05-2254-6]
MAIKVTLDPNFTVGDLYAFVDLLRAANIDSEVVVGQVNIANDDEILDHYEIELPAATAASTPRMPDAPWHLYREALDDIIAGDGNAQRHLEDLAKLRDALPD